MGYLPDGRTLSPPSKGYNYPDCILGTCNPINFVIFKPLDWEQGCTVSVKINGSGYDPGVLLPFKLITITHESSSYQVFHSFYEEMWSEFPISSRPKTCSFH
jgi:hypothetical protein